MYNLRAAARHLSRKAVRFVSAAAASLVCVLLSSALVIAGPDGEGSTPNGQATGSPAGSYALSGFDNVNLFNGHLNFHLPVHRVAGRGGVGYTITLAIEQRWRGEGDPYAGGQHPVFNGWGSTKPGYGPGILEGRQLSEGCGDFSYLYTQGISRLTFTSGDGTEYELLDTIYGGQVASSQCNYYNHDWHNGASRGTVFVTRDGTSATFVSDSIIKDVLFDGGSVYHLYPSGYLMLADGTRHRIDQGRVSWTRDRNGNLLVYTYDAPSQLGRLSTITDSLGRQVNIAYDVNDPQFGLCDTITFTGYGGAQRKIRIAYRNLADVLVSGTTDTYKGLFPLLNGSSTTHHNPRVASAVWLPDDPNFPAGRGYQFRYNKYAELSRVELPTGGVIVYEWGAGYTGGDPSGAGGSPDINRRVLSKSTYTDAGTLAGVTTFGFFGSDGGVWLKHHDTDPARTVLAQSKHYFIGNPFSYVNQWGFALPDLLEGRESQTEFYHTNGALLRRVTHTWVNGGSLAGAPSNPRITQTVNTLADTNQVSRQTFNYDQYNNETDVYEYDFGAGAAGPLLRRTHTDFVTTGSYVNANVNPSLGAHLRRLALQQWVSSDAGGASVLSRVVYEYDNYTSDARHAPLVARAGITGLCLTLNSAGSCVTPSDTGFTTRGNVTGVTAYANAAAQTGPSINSTRYDVAGNAVATIDPREKVATAGFADSFCNGSTCGGGYVPNTYAFPTSTTSPVPDPSGQYGSASALTTSTQYDFGTGLPTAKTDANNRTSTYAYDDPLDRPSREDRPGGGWTVFTYNRSMNAGVMNDYVCTQTALDASRALVNYQFFDGLGRPTRTFLYEGGSPAVFLTNDTRYDPLGRVWRISRQYRTQGSSDAINPSGRWTETVYDPLGRVSTVTTRPDNAVVTNTYSGQYSTIVDQLGSTRRSKTDALGRLVRVDEPDASGNLGSTEAPAQPTHYTYDALSNLRKVDQGGQYRYFMYDSLSRLVRVRHPEHGTHPRLNYTDAANNALTGNADWSVAYGYDAAGNLTSRVDARNVETNYAFDALNRNTTTTYLVLEPASHIGATPNVTRTYDGATLGKGRPWRVESAQNARVTYEEFNALGQPLRHSQQFWAGAGWGAAYTTQYGYNLAGSVASQIYPSGRTTAYQYDAAGRLGDNGAEPAFKGTLGDGAQRTYASALRYNQMGGMEQEQFGTQTPVYNKRFYNVRGQLSEIRVSTHSITAPGQETNWNRGALINHYSHQTWAQSGTDNNGNLRKQDVYIPNNDAITGYTLTTYFYDYDSLNRLDVAREVRDGVNTWMQDYAYDRYGNRTIVAANTWGGVPEPQFEQDAANPSYREVAAPSNRLYAPGDGGRMPGSKLMGYDAAGHLINDSYTGGGARAYDAEGRMTSAQFVSGQSQTAVYTYDGEGRRVKRQAGAGAAVWQVFGTGGELLAEYAANAPASSPQKEYGYRAGELLITAEGSGGGGGTLTNVSDGMPATQSSTGWGGDASRAVDGTTDGAWASGSVSHTNGDAQGWWQVDLQSVRQIGRVDFWLMTECCSSHGDFDVKVSDDGVSWSSYYVGGPVDSGSVSPNRTGRYVRLQLRGTDYLALAEVRVWESSGGGSPGLRAEYFNSLDFTNPALTRTDAAVNFDWGGGSPAAGVNVDNFTTRWTGTVTPLYSQTYTFYTVTDDGVRLWVNNQLVIDKWIDQPPTEWSGQITLQANTPYQIKLEFYERGGGAMARLYWSSASQPKEIVPSGRLSTPPGGGGGGGIRWLVSDQLGTPRMVLDQTGSLAGVTRHDYLPYGEEIGAGIGGRTTAQGYSAYDGVRQHFTSKERDDETTLDYFSARYYSSAQGRFTSPDSLLGSADNMSPQTWNRYAYGRNNPLRNIDPLGLWDWDASAGGCYADGDLVAMMNNKKLKKSERNWAKRALQFRQRFRAALAAANNAAQSDKLNNDRKQQVQQSVDSYGSEGDGNGVGVGVRSNSRGSKAYALLNEDDTISVVFNEGLKEDQLAVVVAHEGRHVADAQAWVNAGHPTGGPTDLNHYSREQRAWYVSSYVAEALNMKSVGAGGGDSYVVWKRGWKAADRERLRSAGVEYILLHASSLRSTDTDTYSREHKHR